MDLNDAPFFVLEGIDGSGKSTQQELLAEHLRAGGHDVVTCRDPGSTELGEAVRSICLDHHGRPISPRSEMLLYMAARAQLVDEIVRPALEAGKVVVCDRFLLSTIAYQGYGNGTDVDSIWCVGRVAIAGCTPGLTLLLDLPAERAAVRRTGPDDRIESRGLEYLSSVRDGFLEEARRSLSEGSVFEVRVVDADRPPDEIAKEIASHVDAWFAQRWTQ